MKVNYAMLFPGQGAQTIHMCRRIYQAKESARQIFDCSSEILGYDIWEIVSSGRLQTLTQTPIAQPAVFIASYLMFLDFLEKYAIFPNVVVGHSLGEISALVCAGGIKFEEALIFIKQRAKLMNRVADEKIGFSGLITDLKEDDIDKLLNEVNNLGYVSISGYNSSKQFVIAGVSAIEKKLDKEVAKLGGEYIPFRMIPMKVSAPYHTKLMKKYDSYIKGYVSQMQYTDLKIPVLSTVSGDFIKSSSEIPELLIQQMSSPVLWNKTMEILMNNNHDFLVDIGPNSIMKNLVLESDSSSEVYAFDKEEAKIMNLLK